MPAEHLAKRHFDQAHSEELAKKDLRDLCRTYTAKAVERLGDLISDTSPDIALKAITEILNRGWGKPVSEIEVLNHVAINLLHSDGDGFISHEGVVKRLHEEYGDGYAQVIEAPYEEIPDDARDTERGTRH